MDYRIFNVRMCFFVCMRVHTGDIGLLAPPKDFSLESAQNLAQEKYRGGRQAWYVTVIRLCADRFGSVVLL